MRCRFFFLKEVKSPSWQCRGSLNEVCSFFPPSSLRPTPSTLWSSPTSSAGWSSRCRPHTNGRRTLWYHNIFKKNLLRMGTWSKKSYLLTNFQFDWEDLVLPFLEVKQWRYSFSFPQQRINVRMSFQKLNSNFLMTPFLRFTTYSGHPGGDLRRGGGDLLGRILCCPRLGVSHRQGRAGGAPGSAHHWGEDETHLDLT